MLLTLLPLALASDPDRPHPHRGLIAPITSAPAAVALSPEEEARLQAGEAVLRQRQGDSGGAGVAVQLIEAPAAVVWDTILRYDKYDDWVKNVTSATIYRSEGEVFHLDMQLSILGFKSGMYTVNTVRRDQGYMSWTLDYDRRSDVDDNVGYWRVEQLREEPPLTRLEYSAEMRMSGVPEFIVSYLTRDSLPEGTGWVKQRAEEAAAR